MAFSSDRTSTENKVRMAIAIKTINTISTFSDILDFRWDSIRLLLLLGLIVTKNH